MCKVAMSLVKGVDQVWRRSNVGHSSARTDPSALRLPGCKCGSFASHIKSIGTRTNDVIASTILGH
jgi:hypothetical protein